MQVTPVLQKEEKKTFFVPFEKNMKKNENQARLQKPSHEDEHSRYKERVKRRISS